MHFGLIWLMHSFYNVIWPLATSPISCPTFHPLAHYNPNTLAFFLFLHHTKLGLTSKPLHMPIPLPGLLFPGVFIWLALLHYSDFGLNATFLRNSFPESLSNAATPPLTLYLICVCSLVFICFPTLEWMLHEGRHLVCQSHCRVSRH